jgi:putative MATE family efflux protein
MYFIAVACVINIALDYILIGCLGFQAEGAALATVISQSCSVLFALGYLHFSKEKLQISGLALKPDPALLKKLLQIGLPVAVQDGLIQVSFMVITVIVNQRGVYAAAGVGIVEKIISVLFLVPSTMMSTVSALAAQNYGAGLHERARKTMGYAILICICSGVFFTIICECAPAAIVGIFTHDAITCTMGARYLQSYVFDCIIAGIHFCFSGYFCAYNKSYLSFIHNMIAILVMRIPGAYLLSLWFPDDLFPMGMAAPIGSAISAVICVLMYLGMQKKRAD